MNAVAYPPGVNRYKLVLVTDYSDLVPSGSDLVQHGLTNCISKSVEKCLDDILREHGLMMGKTDTAGSKYGRIKCNCRLDRLTCRSVEAFLEYRNAREALETLKKLEPQKRSLSNSHEIDPWFA